MFANTRSIDSTHSCSMMFQTFTETYVSGSLTLSPAFTSRDVARFTGISLRQLQWWDERGLVVPVRQGHKRLYSLDDLAEVAIICELRDRGFSLQKVRRIVRFLQRELGKRLVDTVHAASEFHLLTDGRHIFLEDSARGVIDILKNSRQPMLTVCLSDTVERIQARVSGDRKRSAFVGHPTRQRKAS